jgi:hypothetical protein
MAATSKIEQHSHLLQIYSGRTGIPSRFKVIAPKEEGSSIGSIFEKERTQLGAQETGTLKRWVGKIGLPNPLLSAEGGSAELVIHEMNLTCVGEKIASDCYKELSNDKFLVPKTQLSEQPILDKFTESHPKLQELLDSLSDEQEQKKEEIPRSLRIMSQLIEQYVDFRDTYAVDDDYNPISFCGYMEKFHRPPVELINPEGVTVPILGLMEALAVGRALADPDILGGYGMNAGIVWVKNQDQKTVSAKVVKVDPGAAFSLNLPFQKNPNLVLSALNHQADVEFELSDVRDIQTSCWNHKLIIQWSCLLDVQKKEFLSKLSSAKNSLGDPKILSFLLYRDGMFNLGGREMIPDLVLVQYKQALIEWLNWQMEIYQSDIIYYNGCK